MNNVSTPPVLLLIFNRPDLTERVFERIREAAPRRLFIAADGPRADRSGEAEVCENCRSVVARIDWDCEVHHLYREANLGCKVAVSSAIDWFFEHVESGIILEDDCLPAPVFFQFCWEMLERFRAENRIMVISGANLLDSSTTTSSYYFSKYPNIWGWATWKRVWRQYDGDLKDWVGGDSTIKGIVDNRRTLGHFTKSLHQVKSGELNTWDIQLAYLLIKSGGVAVIPAVNMIENIGFDSRATHTKSGSSPAVKMSLKSDRIFPLKHPDQISADHVADAYMERRFFSDATIFQRAYRRFLRLLHHGS